MWFMPCPMPPAWQKPNVLTKKNNAFCALGYVVARPAEPAALFAIRPLREYFVYRIVTCYNCNIIDKRWLIL
ncbi:MAG: hypothetical protein WBQ62_04805, partial [Dehalococcoidales bacterium]